jgi:uncharacterized protein (DUF2062 family)
MQKSYLKLVRQAIKTLRHPRLRHRPWWRTLSRPLFNRNLWIPCRDSVASGLAIGLFFSVMLIPFQTLPTALITLRVRGTTPAILFGQFRLGQWMRDTLAVPMPDFLTSVHFHASGVGTLNAASFILGMITSGVLLALCAYPVVHLFSAILPHLLPIRSLRSRNTRHTPPETKSNVS